MAAELHERPLTRNTISAIGMLIVVLSVINIIFLAFMAALDPHGNPYLGIFAYVVAPSVLIAGIALIITGMIIERRRRRRHYPEHVSPYPELDFNQPKVRRIFTIIVVAGVLFIVGSTVGSYQAYHYTDSDQFCGTVCHQVMKPEYTAYKASPHARVGCVNCHIGTGATWYVRSKLSGAYQVYSTLFHKYSRPIESPVANLRPAQETCEHCHWPEKFFGAQMKVFNHYGFDEQNTPRQVTLLIKTGGGSPTTGITAGIHWHMNIANEISYVASDRQRQVIPWVRMKDHNGKVTDYFVPDSKMTQQQIDAAPKRRMDCVDCHNRPTHIYVPPDRAVDRAMVAGRVDPSLPYIKQKAVDALSKPYKTTPEAVSTIARDINSYYSSTYPDVFKTKAQNIQRSIKALQDILQTTRFPEMNVDWRTHPDNVGHFYSQGCFRCHDDNHVSKDGRKITKDCNACHTVLGQSEAGVLMYEQPNSQFQHPIDIGDLTSFNCTDCHSGSGIAQ